MRTSTRAVSLLRHASDPLLRNSFLLALNVVIGSTAGFVYWTLAARLYGTRDVGAAGAVTAMLPLVTTCASLGLAEMLVRHFAREANQARMLLRSTSVVVSVCGLLGSLWWLLAGDRSPLREVSTDHYSLLLLLWAVIASGAGLLTTATMIAARRPDLVLVESSAGALVRIGSLVLLRDLGASGILASFALGASAATITGWVLIAVIVRPRRDSGSNLSRDQRRFALVNWTTSLVSMTPRAAAATLIVWRAGTEVAAWVAIPLMMLPMLTIAPSVLGRSLFAEASSSPGDLHRMLRKAVVAALGFTGTGMLVVLVAAPTLLGLFGEEYVRESSTMLRLLAVAAVVAAPNYMLDVALNVSGHRREFLVTNLAGTTSLLVSLVLLSPAGPNGIGAAWVVGQACYLLVATASWRACSRRPRERAEGN